MTVDEVMPGEATGRVAEIYDDVRDSLRVPFVNFVFRALATEPDVLDALWSRLRPVVRSEEAARLAGRLRDAAELDVPVEVPAFPDEAAAFSAAIHGVLPFLLLVANGAAVLLDGDLPDGPRPPLTERETGVPEGAVEVTMVDPDDADPPVAALLADIRDRHGHPAPASYFRALARWPDLLAGVWSGLRPVVGTPPYRGRGVELTELARREVRGLLAGAAPVDAPHVRDTVAVFRTSLVPDLLLDVALVEAARPR